MRRRRRSSNLSPLGTLNPETIYARKKAAEWLVRLLDCSVALDDAFFKCAGWCIGGLRPVLHSLQEALEKNRHGGKKKVMLQSIKECLEEPESFFDDALMSLVGNHPRITKPLQDIIHRECERAAGMKVDGFTLARAKKLTKNLFGLSDEAVRICEYAFIVGNFDKSLDTHAGQARL